MYYANVYTVVCNYLSTRVTKTCSVGQSKFKVLTIKLRSLPTHFEMFWRNSPSDDGKLLKGSKVDQQCV